MEGMQSMMLDVEVRFVCFLVMDGINQISYQSGLTQLWGTAAKLKLTVSVADQ